MMMIVNSEPAVDPTRTLSSTSENDSRYLHLLVGPALEPELFDLSGDVRPRGSTARHKQSDR